MARSRRRRRYKEHGRISRTNRVSSWPHPVIAGRSCTSGHGCAAVLRRGGEVILVARRVSGDGSADYGLRGKKRTRRRCGAVVIGRASFAPVPSRSPQFTLAYASGFQPPRVPHNCWHGEPFSRALPLSFSYSSCLLLAHNPANKAVRPPEVGRYATLRSQPIYIVTPLAVSCGRAGERKFDTAILLSTSRGTRGRTGSCSRRRRRGGSQWGCRGLIRRRWCRRPTSPTTSGITSRSLRWNRSAVVRRRQAVGEAGRQAVKPYPDTGPLNFAINSASPSGRHDR